VVADAVYIVKVEDLTDAVTWVPALPASGTYQVYAKWTADETRATDARYAIVHEGGTAEVSVNQRAAGGLWQYLGSYAFDPLNTPTVTLAANDNGSVAADAVRFVGGPGGATDIAYLHSDHLGTPQAITDANAQVLWWRDQTPFGQTVAEGGFSVSPLRFPGQYADTESGLAYNYFRDYDPALGRYIQSDPIGLGGGLNTYGYVGGNPVRWVDPNGLLNPVKYLVCLAHAANAGRLYASGTLKFAAAGAASGTVVGVPAAIPLAAWGTANIYGATGAQKKAMQLCMEAANEMWTDASWKNLWALAPGGTSCDDPTEPSWIEYWSDNPEGMLEEAIQYLP
jgi:RHS repeat-associated protein